ncbi:hypothetical protein [Streptomyces sp. NPDC056949]|uniref:hypothetical protein n=1 Tax=Streptomyces sp. NPDC056949 TaxID=3345976 RepID=UPI00362545A5
MAVSACAVLVACTCGPEKTKDDTDAKPSPPSASARAKEPSATSPRTEKPSAAPSPAQKKALQTATVDPKRVVVRTPDKIEMPLQAVRSSAAFSESDLGNYTLEYLKNDWYITD